MEVSKGKLTIKKGVNWDDVDPKLRGSIEKLVDRGVSIRVTSGKDSKHKTTSHHYKGQAIDITPEDRVSYDEMLIQFRENPDILEELKSNGYRLYDERTKKGKEWSGAHFHIGQDSKVPLENWDTLPVSSKLYQDKNINSTRNSVKNGLLGLGFSYPMANTMAVGITTNTTLDIPNNYLLGVNSQWNQFKMGKVPLQYASNVEKVLSDSYGDSYELLKGIKDYSRAYDIFSSMFLNEKDRKEVTNDAYINSIKNSDKVEDDYKQSVMEMEKDERLKILQERQEERNMVLSLANNAIVEPV